jgi:uncharacterized protein YbjT (DUF2867 family)
MAHILVTGGTGTLGRQLIRQLSYQGFDVGILTTRPNVDLPSGARIFAGDLTRLDTIQHVVREATIIIHCASNPRDAHSVDVEGTRNLLAAADANRLQHLVYLSIAGIDHSPHPYYKAKLEAERMIKASALPWSILRATQFHDFVLHRLIESADHRDGSPLAIPGSLKFQSVDVKDVSWRLQNMAMGKPLHETVTMGGPGILTLEQMTRAYLGAQNRNEGVRSDDNGIYFEIFKSGMNVNPEWTDGKISWDTFLANRL